MKCALAGGLLDCAFMKTAYLLAAIALASVACSTTTGSNPDGTEGPGGKGPSPTVPLADCKNQCGSKLQSCGIPESATESLCESRCSTPVTSAQLACHTQKDCKDIMEKETIAALCPPKDENEGPMDGADGPYPNPLEITARFGRTEAKHLRDGQTVASTVEVAGPPKFSPTAPINLPDIGGAPFTLTSPSRGSCDADIAWQVTNETIEAEVLIATDALPSTACAAWTDKIAKEGIKGTFDATYPGGKGAVKLTVELTP